MKPRRGRRRRRRTGMLVWDAAAEGERAAAAASLSPRGAACGRPGAAGPAASAPPRARGLGPTPLLNGGKRRRRRGRGGGLCNRRRGPGARGEAGVVRGEGARSPPGARAGRKLGRAAPAPVARPEPHLCARARLSHGVRPQTQHGAAGTPPAPKRRRGHCREIGGGGEEEEVGWV